MSDFISKAKELIASSSNGKINKDNFTNKKLRNFLKKLMKYESKEKADENDLLKSECFK